MSSGILKCTHVIIIQKKYKKAFYNFHKLFWCFIRENAILGLLPWPPPPAPSVFMYFLDFYFMCIRILPSCISVNHLCATLLLEIKCMYSVRTRTATVLSHLFVSNLYTFIKTQKLLERMLYMNTLLLHYLYLTLIYFPSHSFSKLWFSPFVFASYTPNTDT